MFKARSAFIAVLVFCACAVFAVPASAATTIGLAPDTSVHGPFQAQCYWSANAPTFGQTITVPAGDNVLDRFSFYLVENHNTLSGSPLGPQTVTYKAYVYQWDAGANRAVGPALWQSPTPQVVTTSTSIQEVVAETGGVQLQSGVQYVVFFSVSETSASNADGAGGCFMYPPTFGGYPGGSWEFMINGTDTSLWTTQSWPLTGDSDVAFSATFSTPVIPDPDPEPEPEPEPVYDFDGFYAPVENRDAAGTLVLNRVQGGSAIPLKFRLGDGHGVDVFADGYPKSETIACDSQAEVNGIDSTVNAGASTLQYDPVTGIYTYVWKTDKAWADTCRQLVLKFDDGQTARANFLIK